MSPRRCGTFRVVVSRGTMSRRRWRRHHHHHLRRNNNNNNDKVEPLWWHKSGGVNGSTPYGTRCSNVGPDGSRSRTGSRPKWGSRCPNPTGSGVSKRPDGEKKIPGKNEPSPVPPRRRRRRLHCHITSYTDLVMYWCDILKTPSRHYGGSWDSCSGIA